MNETELQQKSNEADYRSNVYGLLAAVFGQEVTPELLVQIKDPRFLGVLSELGVGFQNGLFDKPDQTLLEDLSVEYAKLFLGPGKHISPHESVHHVRKEGKWGQLWGDSTVEVKKFIESAGFDYKPEHKGIPDHISVEFEFMQQVTLVEAQAWKDQHNDKALYCLNIEKKFIEEHLVCWIPTFCEKVIQQTESSFYQGLAELAQKFIEFERKELA